MAVAAAAGQHLANPAAGILHIAAGAGNDVNVQVHHRLTGGFTFVDADIKPVGSKALPEKRLHLPVQGKKV